MIVEDQPLYDPNLLGPIDLGALASPQNDGHPPRILLLYGSLLRKVFCALWQKKAGEFCKPWVLKSKFLILLACPFQTQCLTAIPKCKNCESWLSGVRVWFGLAPNGMAPWLVFWKLKLIRSLFLPSLVSDWHKEKLWLLSKFLVDHTRLIQSIKCEFWAVGCGWLRSLIKAPYQRLG